MEESIATLRFADNAKSVFVKINPNQIVANDVNLVQKLTMEINNLKHILSLRKKRGNFGDIESELLKLKSENDKLKQIAINKDGVEKLLSENKLLKLELQKLRTNEGQVTEGNSSSAWNSKNNSNNNKDIDNVNYLYSPQQDNKKYNIDSFPIIDNKLKSKKDDSNSTTPINKYQSTSTIHKTTTNTYMKSFNSASERLKLLEKMEKQNENLVKRELEKIRETKRKREEDKITKSIEVY
jgi:regulator of replication initiation timing